MVKAFEAAASCVIPYSIVARRAGDAAITVADPSLARERLDWRTQRSLEDMCRDGWAWQSANPQDIARDPSQTAGAGGRRSQPCTHTSALVHETQ